jgi:hypothetical protein
MAEEEGTDMDWKGQRAEGNGQRKGSRDKGTGRRRGPLAALAATAAIVASIVAAPAAAQQHSHPPTVAGKWTMTIESSPHGPLTMGLALEQDGTAVSGSFASPHGEMAVAGEFTDRTLTLKTKGDAQITLNAKLKDDGTLAGYLSSEMGDMTWTAARVKDPK